MLRTQLAVQSQTVYPERAMFPWTLASNILEMAGGVRASWVGLEVHSDHLFSAGGVLDQPLESVQLPWGVRTKDPIQESRIPGPNAGELLPLISESSFRLYVITHKKNPGLIM